MSTIQKLATRLKQLRKKHDLTQEEFGSIAGFSRKHVQILESGKQKEIYVSTVERLAAPYGLESWQLLAPKFPKSKLVSKPTSSRIHTEKRPTKDQE